MTLLRTADTRRPNHLRTDKVATGENSTSKMTANGNFAAVTVTDGFADAIVGVASARNCTEIKCVAAVGGR